MSNEVLQTSGQVLTLNFGSVDMTGLTPEQQNELRMIVAKKQVELASDLAKKRIQIEAATTDIDVALNAVDRLSRGSSSFKVSSHSSTASGSTSITAGKVKLFG